MTDDPHDDDAFIPPVVDPDELADKHDKVLQQMRREAAYALAHKDRIPKPSMTVGWRGVLSMVEDELDQRREERIAERDNQPIRLHVGIFTADGTEISQRYAITPEEADHWSKHTDVEIVGDALDRMADAVADRWGMER